ncbi:hypothetical protein [Paraliomyxa miuraensis]|uniref:hypothetical protein n=1 Tax=Paraliomyxa miuraensis TaxID=376150 RepID=UPI00224F2834|nr:hypothetical protein [Paraliomyxa miuraensis]MCX4241820.1 hypothetical protein [Paraliomyxa miuraensis]
MTDDASSMSPGARLWALSWSVGLLLAVLWPILRDPPRDGFPLSNYPMFSRDRRSAEAEIPHVVGWSREGRHRPVPPELLGTAEVMQAHQTVHVAIRRGRASALCQSTAEHVRRDPAHADLEHLEVRTDTYDALTYFSGDTKPRATRIHARCSVEEGTPPVQEPER